MSLAVCTVDAHVHVPTHKHTHSQSEMLWQVQSFVGVEITPPPSAEKRNGKYCQTGYSACQENMTASAGRLPPEALGTQLRALNLHPCPQALESVATAIANVWWGLWRSPQCSQEIMRSTVSS